MRPPITRAALRIQTIFAVALFAAVVAPAQAWTFKVIHSFCQKPACVDGYYPSAHLLLDASGNVFGTSDGGGKVGGGAIFELSPNGDKWTYKALYRARTPDIFNTSLIMDTSGNLYGTTFQGGKYFGGSAYELLRPQDGGQWKLKTLYSFCGTDPCPNGRHPEDGLAYAGQATGALYDGLSSLYAGTQIGGSTQDQGSGVIYELSHKAGSTHWREKVIYAFCQPDCSGGRHATHGGLTLDKSGNLFGAAKYGGAGNQGTIFELSPAGHGAWAETTLYSFCTVAPCTDGASPDGGLLFDGSGNLLGTTFEGGNVCAIDSYGCGVAFKLLPNGAQSTYSVLYSFCSLSDCADGAGPGDGLLLDASGNVSGTTLHGGAKDALGDDYGGGTVFQLGDTEEVLHSFCQKADCTDGHEPVGGVVKDIAGNYFGVSENGGKNQAGVIFELSP